MLSFLKVIYYFLMIYCFYFTCMSTCQHVCLCPTCLPGAFRGQKRASESLELERCMVVSQQGAKRWEPSLGPMYEHQVPLIAEPLSGPLMIS